MAAREAKRHLFPSEHDRIDQFCFDYFEKAHEKWSRFGAFVLRRKEKHALAVMAFRSEVGNGGIIQFLGNEAGAFASWGEKAFELIGVPEYAKIIKDLKAMFPKSKIPRNPNKRWKIAETLDDEILESMSEKVWEKEESNIRRKLYLYLKE